ncbi:recombinase family protein [Leptolyngbya sp. 7M]|uniref:recombinase family protein n=1 Tax=Leptolyngbya sp. 7M TaxID=2812896 RepID=UPI001B8D2410|nr:recombinase family protein [Leptolyngbya sp. 7M]QYO64635.1 recombinase family protein [Leptolyngbya sp. 7M]
MATYESVSSEALLEAEQKLHAAVSSEAETLNSANDRIAADFKGDAVEKGEFEAVTGFDPSHALSKGRVDVVVVYKVDRLSRSLADFARLMQTFDEHNVSFVSVTQQFNTTTSMGRLTLNMLLSFAQFEREVAGERIRDKIAAQKRRGKWAGGVPILGYDVDRSGSSPRLVVNPREAAKVRAIFQMYLDKGSLQRTVTELRHREWKNKRRVTKKGESVGGQPFNTGTLHVLLTNPLLTGKIVHRGNTYDGEHEAIVDSALFQRVRQQLLENGRTGGIEMRNKYGALLRGLIRCKKCDCAMIHTFYGKGNKQYRYYRCLEAIKNGAHTCEASSLPGLEIEKLVVDEIRTLGNDRALLDRILAEAQVNTENERAALNTERASIHASLGRMEKELRELVADKSGSAASTARLASAHEQVSGARSRLAEIETRLGVLGAKAINREEARRALNEFDGVWSQLSPREQGGAACSS